MTYPRFRRYRSLALMPIVVVASVRPAPGQRPAAHPTVVYAVGAEPTMPIPLLTRNQTANDDLSDQLFLHLVAYAPGGRISGDNAMVPALAKSWHRIDPLTLIFDIDPRARWQDGAPVTAHDVVYTWQLATNPKVATDLSRLEPIAGVEAVDERSVRVRFKRPSPEQVYDFGFLIQPLPSHLLESLAPGAIATSEFAQHPIGDGPFRIERRVPGQFVELRADSTFFLGRPTIARVLFRVVEDPTARVNLFLTGETDVLDQIPLPELPQVRAHADARIIDVASNDISYLLFNTRSPADTTKPNPLFTDPRVREALTLALDRVTIAHTAFGPATEVPDAAQSQLWSWITGGTIAGRPQNVARARQLLAAAGWRDSDGDGVLDRGGVPLQFSILYPASSAPRHTIAVQAQQMWRAIGVHVELDRVDPAVIGARVTTGKWDMLVGRAGQDPTPTSLVQSWSCDAAHRPSTNYAHWCDPTFDQLMVTAATAKDQAAAWRAVLARMALERPAIFVAAASNPIAVNRRYDNVVLWPSRTWLSLWQWRVRPNAALPRDR